MPGVRSSRTGVSGEPKRSPNHRRFDPHIESASESNASGMDALSLDETREVGNPLQEPINASSTPNATDYVAPIENDKHGGKISGVTDAHNKNEKNGEVNRKPKITLSKLLKFRPSPVPNSKIHPPRSCSSETASKDECLNNNDDDIIERGIDNKAEEAKQMDFGLYKPSLRKESQTREGWNQRKMSHEKVMFHLGSDDSESEAEGVVSKETQNGDDASSMTKKYGRQDLSSQNVAADESPSRNNQDGSTSSLASGMSISSIALPSSTVEEIDTSNGAISDSNTLSKTNCGSDRVLNNGVHEASSEHPDKEESMDCSRTSVFVDYSRNSNSNYDSINSNGSSKAMNNIVQGILRKSFDRDQTASMSEGLRRYRRRSQMSITSEIPADVPPKQRRAECESRIRDNLDYFRRRVSVQEENNIVIGENGAKTFVRNYISIDDDGGRGDEAVSGSHMTQPYNYYNHGFKASSSAGSMSPMSLSPTTSTIFDYGSSVNGRRSATGSMSSVRWEDIELAENNNNNNKMAARSNKFNDAETEQPRMNQIGYRNSKRNMLNCGGAQSNGFQRNDVETVNGDAGGDGNRKMKSKRRQGSVDLPLNVVDLVDQEVGVRDDGSYGLRRVLNNGVEGEGDEKGVEGRAAVAEDRVDDDPPPYVPMKRRQVERTGKTDWSRVADQSLPDNFRRHSSASVDSAWSTGSAASSASILKEDALAIFNRKSSNPIRRLSQISLTDFENIRRKHMDMTKREWLSTYSLHIFVLLIFLVTVLSVSLAWYFRNLSIKMLQQNQRVFFDPRTRKLSLTDPTDKLSIEGFLGLDMPRWQLPLHCPLVVGQDPSMRSCEWKNNAILTIDHFGTDLVQCYNVTWKSQHPWHVPYDCFHLKGAEWFGPSNNSNGAWPITGNFSYSPTNQRPSNNGVFGSVADLYWLSSSGVGLRIHGDDPVHIKWNRTKHASFCILSNYTGSLYDQTSLPMLKYTICNGKDTVHTHEFMHRVFPPKQDITFPPDYVFSGYYWSTKGILGSRGNITQDDVINLVNKARNFSSRKLPSSSSLSSSSFLSSSISNDVKITLDSNWQKEEGDLTFGTELFPNVTEMWETIRQTGSHVILSISPHVYFTSASFQQGIAAHFFVKDASGAVTGLVEFEGGVASVVDVMKDEARMWLTEKLKALLIPNVTSSLRLSFGDQPWLPFKPHFGVPSATPNVYIQKLGEIISDLSDVPINEHTSNTRHLTQLIPVRSDVQIQPSSGRKCVRGIVETALTLGMMGYPFVMADGLVDHSPVPAGDESDSPRIPSRELYIRWLQVATFFPATQLSTAPWQYDAEVVAMATNYSVLHDKRVLSIYQTPSLREEVIVRGFPLLRPVWWADPSNQDLLKFKIDDEFTVGDNLLVAPVLCEGIRKRHVYIPSGVWEDIHLSRVILGPNILEDYPVPLHQIAVFKRRETVM